jgi:DNA-directed RNA polymerase subunit RPC12/RpoP
MKFLLGSLLSNAMRQNRYSHGDIRARRGFGFDQPLPTQLRPPCTAVTVFNCKSCHTRLRFDASTWLYNCPSCASSYNRADFNREKASYLADPFCHTTRGNFEERQRQKAEETANPGYLNAIQLKCENCTAVLTNDGATNTLKCPYCGSIYMKR